MQGSIDRDFQSYKKPGRSLDSIIEELDDMLGSATNTNKYILENH